MKRFSGLGLVVMGLFGCGSASTGEWKQQWARPDPARLSDARVEASKKPNAVPPVEPVAQTSTAPSCVGEVGNECRGVSCCRRLPIPAGEYVDAKAGSVHVEAFDMDEFELTVGRVRAWNRDGAKVPAVGDVVGHTSSGNPITWASDWHVQSGDELRGWARYDTWTAKDAQLPKNFINWYTATAFCNAEGGRLPTDAEWHYAAVGGDENRQFPWGSEPQTPERAIYNCNGDGNKSCSLADILEVGSRPLGVGRWGHMDLAGSMFEWTSDAADGGETEVARGGGFCYIGGIDRRVQQTAAADKARRDAPTTVSHMVGARCVFDAPSKAPEVARR